VKDLYVLRQALGLSQRECAQACGITHQMYGLLETGRSGAGPQTLRKLAKGLHTSVRRLREGDAG